MNAYDRLAYFLEFNKMGALKEDEPMLLETKREECRKNLEHFQHMLNGYKLTQRMTEIMVESAQRSVNHWQMELDDTENDIKKEMEIERNEREATI